MTARCPTLHLPKILALLAGVAVTALSCSDSESPTAPRARALTATISGTLLDADTARPLAGIAVGVSRTDISTHTDAAGSFLLAGVPPGAVALELRGAGVSARTAVTVGGGATALVTLLVSPGRSTVTIVPRSEGVAVEGTVTGINTQASSFEIQTNSGPVTIQTDSSTQFRKGDSPATFADLQIGQEAYVYGTRQKDGSVLAIKVYLDVLRPTPPPTPTRPERTSTPVEQTRTPSSTRTPGGEITATPTRPEKTGTPTATRTPDLQVVLFGTVDSIDSAKASFVLKTDGGLFTILTNSSTEFRKGDDPGSFADLQVGGQAYAAGAKQNDGSVLASKVFILIVRPTPTVTPTRSEKTATPTSTRTPDLQAVLFGTIDSVDSAKGSFVLKTDGGLFTILTNSSTEIRKGDAPGTFADIQVGGKAYALGTKQNDGSVLASKVFLLVPTPTPTPTPTATPTRSETTRTPTRTERTFTPTGTRTPV